MQMDAGSVIVRYFPTNLRQAALCGGVLLSLSGCATQASTTDEAGGSERAVQSKVMHAPLTAVQVGNVAVPSADAVVVRHAGSDYEIEIQSPQGFPVRAFDPVLRVGSKEFHRSRPSATAGEFGVVFTVPSADFDALASGSVISVGYGPGARSARTFGSLDKSTVQ